MGKAIRKKRYLLLVAIALSFVLAVASLLFLPRVAHAATDDDHPFVDYKTNAVGFSNKQFDDSGTSPVSPSGWTLGGIDGASVGNTKAGVVNLDGSAYASLPDKDKKLGLSKYPEYQTATPQTPFGTAKYEGTNKKVLMINTDGSETAVGYTSESVTLEANSYYEFSVYVKTGDFAEGTGASIKLSGLDTGAKKTDDDVQKEAAFHAINTVSDLEKESGFPKLTVENDYGFTKYTFYVETSFESQTVSLVLSVGSKAADADKDLNYFYKANGYAFFDNITVDRLSPYQFAHKIERTETDYGTDTTDVVRTVGTTKVVRLNRAEPLIDADLDMFERVIPEETGVETGNAHMFVYSSDTTFAPDNNENLKSNPLSPNGPTGEILGVSSYNSSTKAYADVNAAYTKKGKCFTVPRRSIWRMSVWVKTQDISGGSASVAIVGDGIVNQTNEDKLDVSQTVTGDDAFAARYGWKQFAFFVRGSALADYEINIELRLGSKDTKASGIVLFSDFEIEPATYAQYSAADASTQVTFDDTFTDTGVTNGNFMLDDGNVELETIEVPSDGGGLEKVKVVKFPLAPADWTRGDPTTVTASGFSTAKVDSSEDAICGLVDIDPTHFDAHRADYNYATRPNTAATRGSVLMLGSAQPTAVYYASPSVTVTAAKNYKLSVSLQAQELSGYGANLVLRDSEGRVLSTIEKILSTGGVFKTYDFYIEGGTADKTVTVEIWLGLNDRKNNTTKLAAGNLFAEKVSFTELTVEEGSPDELAEKKAAFENAVKVGNAGNVAYTPYTFYTFKQNGMTAYDLYDDGTIKTAYNWSLESGNVASVKYGVIDTLHLPTGQTELPATFKRDGELSNTLYLRNTAPAYSALRSATTYSLTENTYYKITVRMKVDFGNAELNDTVIGAGLKLNGTDSKFENIRSTATTTDPEAFREFTFYVNAKSAADVSLTVTLGGEEFSNQHTVGRVYVSSIVFEESNNVEFDEAKNDAYNVRATVEGTADDGDDDNNDDTTPNPNSNLAWWLIPSILIAVAILIAVIGFSVRRILDKKSKRKTTEKMPSYDRRAASNVPTAPTDKTGTALPQDDATYDDFADDGTVVKTPAKAKAEPVEEPTATEEPKTEEPTATEELSETTEGAEITEQAEAVEPAEKTETVAPTEETTTAEKAQDAAKPVAQAKPDAYVDEFDD